MPTALSMIVIVGSSVLVCGAVVVAAAIKQLAARIPEIEL